MTRGFIATSGFQVLLHYLVEAYFTKKKKVLVPKRFSASSQPVPGQ